MKKTLAFLAFLPVVYLNTSFAQTITCPTAKQANRLFKYCQIKVGKNSCGGKFHGQAIVLNSPVEGLYGGAHTFKGFTQFKGVQILSNHYVCKYVLTKGSKKMSWIIGSQHRLPKNCRLTNAKNVSGTPTCMSKNPKHCKIVCG